MNGSAFFSRRLSLVARHLSSEGRRLFLWAPVLLGCGIGVYFALPAEPPAYAGALPFLPLIAAAWRFKRGNAWLPCLILALPALGFMAAQARTAAVAQPLLHEKLTYRDVTGHISGVMETEQGTKLMLTRLHVEGLPAEATPRVARITFRKRQDVRIGDDIAVKATLLPLPSPAAPGSFDFGRYFYFAGLGAVGYATGHIEMRHRAEIAPWQEKLDGIRLKLSQDLRERIPGAGGAVAAALTMGDMSAIPKDANDAMRDAGLSHILSISGLHLSLAAGIFFFAVRLMLALVAPVAPTLPVKKIAAFAALVSALAYLLLAGSPVPAVRSFVMVAFVLAAVLIDRRGLSLVALAWAAFGILLFEPDSMLGASFQMSFMATLSIVSLYERHGRRLRYKGGWIRRLLWMLLATMLTSLAATVATAPFIIFHFNRFQPWGLLANVAVGPLTTFLIMPGVVLALLLWPFGWEAPGVWLMRYGIEGMLGVARAVSSLPYAAIPLPPPSISGLLAAVTGLLWLMLWQARWRFFGVPVIVLGMATLLLHHTPDIYLSGDARQLAIRGENGQWRMIKGSARGFTVQNWLRSAGQEGAPAPPARKEPLAGMECEKTYCRYHRDGHSLLLMTDWRYAKELCRDTGLNAVIATFYLRDDECARLPVRIDRHSAEVSGAHALTLRHDAIRMDTVAERQGKRPWVP